MTNGERLAWLRLNAYGVVLACLASMSLTDLRERAAWTS